MRRSRRTPRTSRCASPTDIDESGSRFVRLFRCPPRQPFCSTRLACRRRVPQGLTQEQQQQRCRRGYVDVQLQTHPAPAPRAGWFPHRPGQFGRVDHGQPGDPHRHHRLRPGRRNLRRGDAGGAAADAGAVHHLRRGRLPAADPWLGLRLPVVRPRALLRDHRHAVGLPDRPCVRRHRRDHAQRHHGAGQLRVAEYPHRAGRQRPGWWASAWCSASAC